MCCCMGFELVACLWRTEGELAGTARLPQRFTSSTVYLSVLHTLVHSTDGVFSRVLHMLWWYSGTYPSTRVHTQTDRFGTRVPTKVTVHEYPCTDPSITKTTRFGYPGKCPLLLKQPGLVPGYSGTYPNITTTTRFGTRVSGYTSEYFLKQRDLVPGYIPEYH